MFKNYLKIALRNVIKNRRLFVINVLGLSLGVATCLAIALFVIDELSYDKFNERADNISRVVINAKIGDEIIKESGVMAPLARAMEDEFPQVEQATRVVRVTEQAKVTYGDNTIRNGRFAFVDSNFGKVFTLNWIDGNPDTALEKPNSVILTQAQAKIYFGEENPMDRTLKIEDLGMFGSKYVDNSGEYTVTGLIEALPSTSHFHFDLMASMKSNKDADNQSWLNGNYHTYILFKEGADKIQLEEELPSFTEKYMSSQLAKGLGMTYREFLASGNQVGFFLQPLLDIHLNSDLKGEFEPSGDMNTVMIFAAIGLFMLLIACINFMNLSTANASQRLKEIGVRKVLGSLKGQLTFQFMIEAFIVAFFALLLGVLWFVLALPYFNLIAGKTFAPSLLLNQWILAGLMLLVVLIGFLAGAYPAFFMSSIKPVQALKNKLTVSKGQGARSSLVIFQFTISACLILGALIVAKQMWFIQNKDVGYDREGLLVIREAGLLGNDLDAFAKEVKEDSRVVNMTTSAFVPAGPSDSNMNNVYSKSDVSQPLRTRIFNVDEEYIPTFGMHLLEGRNFSKEFGSEENKVILNETAVKTFGIQGDPIGQTLMEATDLEGGRQALTIIGVVKDFNFKSLKQSIEPLIMKYNPYFGLIIRAKKADMPHLIADLETKWKAFGTKEPFGYGFLDELYNETYAKEQNMGSVLGIFAFLTIFVACLGLFGLVTFTTQRRIKEIGIRKVLGSSMSQIVGMLTKDFLRLVVISLIIAFPLGYYVMNIWLQDFAYRTDIQWWVFAVAGILTLLIAIATISLESIKAARANPVKSLRME